MISRIVTVATTIAVVLTIQYLAASAGSRDEEKSFRMYAEIRCDDVVFVDGEIFMNDCQIENVEFDENG